MAKKRFSIFHRKRNKKLLGQTGVLIGIVFLLVVALLGVIVGFASQQIYLGAKNEVIDRDLLRLRDFMGNLPQMDLYVEYWAEHPREVSQPFTEEEEEALGVYDNVNELINRDLTQLSEEEKAFQARFMYYAVNITFSNEQYTYDYEGMYLLDIRPENAGYVLIRGAEDYDEITIGEEFPLDLKKSSLLKKIRSGNYKETVYEVLRLPTGEAYYIGLAPVMVNGKATMATALIYDWSAFQEKMRDRVIGFDLVILILMIIGALVLLLFLYLTAVRPVTRIQKNVRSYMQDKDSMEFISNMSQIYSRNEFGVLADDLSLMANTLQDFSEKNIGLAEVNAKDATELNLAAKMQSDMLPRKYPDHDQLTVAASMTPAKHVGGDLYDVFEVDGDHVAFLIADVAGKGVPAALLGSSVQTVVKYYTVPGVKPSKILYHLNNEVCAKDLDSMFVTVWIGILNIRTGHFMTSNAGHEYPMFNTGNGYEMFKDVHGMPVGSVEDLPYQDHEFWLKKGDMVFVYTDGAAEATNAKEEMFGTGGILEVLNETPEREPGEILKVMKERIDAFVGEAEQFDDLTMMSVRYNGSGV